MLRVMWEPADALSLTTTQRADLEALVRSGKTPQRVAARDDRARSGRRPGHQRDCQNVQRESTHGVSVA